VIILNISIFIIALLRFDRIFSCIPPKRQITGVLIMQDRKVKWI
jgi:hypothetical protein